jgi:hypothetical protein
LKDAPLETVMHRLALDYDVSIIAPEALLGRQLTLDLKEQPPEVVVELLARLLDTEATLDSGVWILGARKPSDRVVIVRRVRGMVPENVSKVISAVGGDPQHLVVLDSGVVVLGGAPGVITRVNKVLSEVEGVERPLWAVQLHLVTLSSRDLSDLGLSVTPALSLAVNQAVGSSLVANSAALEGKLSAVLRASQTRASVHVVGQPVFLILDGGEASFNRQKQFPYRLRVTSGQTGQVQDSGVSYLSAGTTVGLKVREASASKLMVEMDIEISELGELVAEGLPTRDSRTHKSSAALEDGGCYLLTSFETNASRQTHGTLFNWGRTLDNSQEVLQVWACAVAVSGRLKNGGDDATNDGAATVRDGLGGGPGVGAALGAVSAPYSSGSSLTPWRFNSNSSPISRNVRFNSCSLALHSARSCSTRDSVIRIAEMYAGTSKQTTIMPNSGGRYLFMRSPCSAFSVSCSEASNVEATRVNLVGLLPAFSVPSSRRLTYSRLSRNERGWVDSRRKTSRDLAQRFQSREFFVAVV